MAVAEAEAEAELESPKQTPAHEHEIQDGTNRQHHSESGNSDDKIQGSSGSKHGRADSLESRAFHDHNPGEAHTSEGGLLDSYSARGELPNAGLHTEFEDPAQYNLSPSPSFEAWLPVYKDANRGRDDRCLGPSETTNGINADLD